MKNTGVTNPHTISRLRNNFVRGLNKTNIIPKFVVIVVEDDIVKDVNVSGFGQGEHYHVCLKWLISQYRKMYRSILRYATLQSQKRGLA